MEVMSSHKTIDLDDLWRLTLIIVILTPNNKAFKHIKQHIGAIVTIGDTIKSIQYFLIGMLIIIQPIHSSSIFEHKDDLLIYGLVCGLYEFNATEYAESKDLPTSIVAGPHQSIKTLKMDMLLAGNDGSYDLRLENICLNKYSKNSQSLNNVC